MTRLISVVILFFVTTFHSTIAQVLQGRLLDKNAREPVSFAFIGAGNGMRGTISNEDGYFKIDVAGLRETDTIVVSHIRYVTVRTPIADVLKSNGEILLTEGQTQLKEIEVNATEDDALLQAIQQQSKQDLHFPVTATIYYREWVKENRSYNRFSDGILTVNYTIDKDDIQIKVDQSRAFHLPSDEDELFDINSPLKIESLLRYGYADFLSRFLGERKADYHFYDTEAHRQTTTMT